MRKREKKFSERLLADAARLAIPESLKPEWIEENLKEQSGARKQKERRAEKKTAEKSKRDRGFRPGRFRPALAAAACFCLLSAGVLGLYRAGVLFPEGNADPEGQTEEISKGALVEQIGNTEDTESIDSDEAAGAQDSLQFAQKSYEEIYEILSRTLQSTRQKNDMVLDYGDALADSSSGSVREDALAEESVSSADSASKSFGQTNVQTEGVDEADTIKNDGRYLYQLVRDEDDEGTRYWSIQIVDTKDGLRETARVGHFKYPRELYLWEELLIVLEDGYYTADYVSGTADSGLEDSGTIYCGDVLYSHNQYTKIHIYDISDREKPRFQKTFTLDGVYSTSRLADGYFYGFSFFAPKLEKKTDYDTYIPRVQGALLEEESIICPDSAGGQRYLVMVSVDLRKPQELLDSRAVLTPDGTFYVSKDSIYLASWHSIYQDGVSILYGNAGEASREGYSVQESGTAQDYTEILRFSYKEGKFLAKAEGKVPGRIEDSFSMDQEGELLRVVTTVTECTRRQVTDDRTGEVLGYEYLMPEDNGLSNGIYILDETLELMGSLSGLAEGEQVYSARFLGDTAYFVTFRQTDPLFAVDVSDPKAPKLLSELKVSGFSEYLHFYSENLLLGLGMEADENTGRQEGLKLSMFDLSDPAALTEEARLLLPDYDYSEALYDHRSLLIDPEENLIGFEAQGNAGGTGVQAYLVYAYEDGAFVERLKIERKLRSGVYESCRGTFIGDSFYLLVQDGGVEEYSLETGELTGEL